MTEELAGAGVPGPAEGVGVGLAGPVLIEHGTDALRERFVRRIVTGEISWCQLFSEPGAGSDLAGLTTRAEAVADGWLVTGQKVWSTGAATAQFLELINSDAAPFSRKLASADLAYWNGVQKSLIQSQWARLYRARAISVSPCSTRGTTRIRAWRKGVWERYCGRRSLHRRRGRPAGQTQLGMTIAPCNTENPSRQDMERSRVRDCRLPTTWSKCSRR